MLGSADNLESYSNKYGSKAPVQELQHGFDLSEDINSILSTNSNCTHTIPLQSQNHLENSVQSAQVIEPNAISSGSKIIEERREPNCMLKHNSDNHVISGKSAIPECSPVESDTILPSSNYSVAFSSYQPYTICAEQNLSNNDSVRQFQFFHSNGSATQAYNSEQLTDSFPNDISTIPNNRYGEEPERNYSSLRNTPLLDCSVSSQRHHSSCNHVVSSSCCDCLCIFSKCNSASLTKSCCIPIRSAWNLSPDLRCYPCWPRQRLPNESMLILSVIQLLCGFAAIILSSVGFTKTIFLHQIATGVWAGVIMLITGFHGLIAARRPVMCTLVGLLALCLIVSLAACVLICVSVAGTIEDGFLDKSNVRHSVLREPTKLLSVVRRNFTVLTLNHDLATTLKDSHKSVTTIIPRKSNYNRVRITDSESKLSILSDSHVRTYQIVLHLLLLLVGILEASVSLATSILCCRCVCSRPVNFALRNSRSFRTNIVSLNVATANQAASVLRSGAATNFVGTGNVLLAVSTESRKDGNALSSLLDQNRQLARPYIHHTLVPFLNEFNERSLILTHAGTGSLAWAAARAAANLVTSRAPEQATFMEDVTDGTQSTHAVNHPAGRRHRISRRRPRILCSNQSSRPRLLYTSFHTPVGQTPSDPPQTDSSFLEPPPFSPRSTLVYVMPSPTRDDPPMIFPPFPPSYSDLQKRPIPDACANSPNQPVSASVRPCRTDGRNSLHSQSQTLPHNETIHHRLSRVFSRSHRRNRRRHNLLPNCSSRTPRSTASAPIPAGDRFIQPVLIIEDPSLLNANGVPDDPPPKYSR